MLSDAASEDAIVRIPNLRRDRLGTLKLISWWQAETVANARIMVVGAGALGNEVLKNLALMGAGHVFVVDRDTIEAANLSRSILYRMSDEGKPKATVAVERMKEINPDVKTAHLVGDVDMDIGLGVFRRMDLVIGCLDSRQARLSVNRACWKVGKPWVDGAIQELFGVARVFVPGSGACYECTLTELDWQIIAQAYPCKGLAVANLLLGKVPTTPTISSIIGGIQTQEALKLLHNMNVHSGKGLIFNGVINDVYEIEYEEKVDCLSHFRYGEIVECPSFRAESTTLADLLSMARANLGSEAVLRLDREIVETLVCPNCHTTQVVIQPKMRITDEDARCQECGQVREPSTTHVIFGREKYMDRTLLEIGIPRLHIIEAHNSTKRMYFELSGDAESLLSYA